MSVLLAILPVALKLIGWILDKKQANDETMKAYLELIAAANKNGLVSIEMKDSFASMEEKLNARIAAGEKPGGN